MTYALQLLYVWLW